MQTPVLDTGSQAVPKTVILSPQINFVVIVFLKNKYPEVGFPCWLSGKESTTNAGDVGSIPDPDRSHMLPSS